MAEDQRKGERRAPFAVDEQKFSTQRLVTYILLMIFSAVTVNVLLGNDQAERSTVLQTIINLTMLVLGFWFGTSKGEADKNASMSRIAEASTPPGKPIEVQDMKVEAEKVEVNKT